MKRLPTFKYVESDYGDGSTLKEEWDTRLEGQEWNDITGQFGQTYNDLAKRNDMSGLGKQCDEGGSTGNQMCKVGYNYKKVKISEYKNRVNDRVRIPAYQVRSMDSPEVKFNGEDYVPSMIYIMDPLANYHDGDLTKRLTDAELLSIEKNNDDDEMVYPFTMHNALPKDPTAYRGVLDGKGNTNFNTLVDEADRYSQFIIEHRPVRSERTDLLWIVVPMKIFVDISGGRYGGEPTTPFESALKWMLQRWVNKVSDDGASQSYEQGETYSDQVELKDAIPNLPTMSPYLYIVHYGNGKKHHVLHFKERHIRTVGVEYYVGKLNRLKDTYKIHDKDATERAKAKLKYREDVYFREVELEDDLDVDVYDSQGEGLVKNKQGVTRSRKGLNMTCRPVKVGGNKYNDDYKYELVSGEIKKQSEGWKDHYKNKYFSGQGRNFGIALVILILMILLVVVGSFFMTRRSMSAF